MPFTTIVIPPSVAHTHTVVFLHGRGDNIRSFTGSLHQWTTSSGQTLFQAFPSFKWVMPEAPKRKCASSVEEWNQWFDVWNVQDFAEREELQAVGLKEVVPEIKELLESETIEVGSWDKIILAGISMGGATSVHTLFNLDEKIGAFLGFSCRLPFLGKDLNEMRDIMGGSYEGKGLETPILLEHCSDDPLVLVENGMKLRDQLVKFGATVEWKQYRDGGHWFNRPTGADDVVSFLRRVLQDNVLPQDMDMS